MATSSWNSSLLLPFVLVVILFITLSSTSTNAFYSTQENNGEVYSSAVVSLPSIAEMRRKLETIYERNTGGNQNDATPFWEKLSKFLLTIEPDFSSAPTSRIDSAKNSPQVCFVLTPSEVILSPAATTLLQEAASGNISLYVVWPTEASQRLDVEHFLEKLSIRKEDVTSIFVDAEDFTGVTSEMMTSFTIYQSLKPRAKFFNNAEEGEKQCDVIHFLNNRGLSYYTSLARRQGLIGSFVSVSDESASVPLSSSSWFDTKNFEAEFLESSAVILAEFHTSSLKDIQSLGTSIQADLATPLVSICITHFNRPKFLLELLTTLESQTYANFEVVIVDDASNIPDASSFFDLLRRSSGIENLKIVQNKENLYLGASRNIAAQNAKGEYLMFLDDDNHPVPELLETLVRAAISQKMDVLTTAQRVVSAVQDGSKTYVPLGPSSITGFFWNCFGDGNFFVKASTFHSLGGFATDRDIGAEDYEFFASASLENIRMTVVPESLVEYQLHDVSQMHLTTNSLENLLRAARPYLWTFLHSESLRGTWSDQQVIYHFLKTISLRPEVKKILGAAVSQVMTEEESSHHRLEKRGYGTPVESVLPSPTASPPPPPPPAPELTLNRKDDDVVEGAEIDFDEKVSGLNLDNFQLTRETSSRKRDIQEKESIKVTGTLTTKDGKVYELQFGSGTDTSKDGTYQLTMSNKGVTYTETGLPLKNTQTKSWTQRAIVVGPTPTPIAGEKEVVKTEDGEEINVVLCSNPNFPYGCNGKCYAFLAECNQGGKEDEKEADSVQEEKVIEVDVIIDDKEETTVPLIGSSKKKEKLGKIKIPPGSFPKGTVLRVANFGGKLPQEEEKKDDDGDCSDGEDDKLESVSPAIELTAYSPKGKQVGPSKLISISQVSQLPKGKDPSEVCLAFNQGKQGDKWVCGGKDLKWELIDKEKNLYLITQEFDHFTGFAVLLGTTGGGCGWGVIQWLCVAFLISAFVLIIIVISWYYLRSRDKFTKRQAQLDKLGSYSGKSDSQRELLAN